MRPHPTSLRLPQSLLDQLDDTPDSIPTTRHGRGRLPTPKVSRKEARKQDREGKKRRKAEYFSSTTNNSKRVAASPHPESRPPKKKTTVVVEPPRAQSSDLRSRKDLSPRHGPSVSKPKGVNVVASSSSTKNPSPRLVGYNFPRSRQEEEEDRYIALLEAKLTSGKRSKNSVGYFKDIEDDGLGGLLGDLDAITTSRSAKQLDNPSHDPRFSDVLESEQSEDEVKDESRSIGFDEWHGFRDTTPDGAFPDGELHPIPPSDSLPLPVQSLPVGTSRYVPPHLREKVTDTKSTEVNVKLTRQLKGLLNKLSEQNIATILDSIETLYREHRRHDVTTSITSFIIESITAHSALLDSYVILHAALIASLHRIVGVEFAAFFVQNVVSSYEHHYNTIASATADEAITDLAGKECSNLIVLLSELYNFQVVSCVLIYDMIRTLLSTELSEFVVELLLKLLRRQQLRQDDPSALKDIIQIVQSKTSDGGKTPNSRTRFMLETLTNLKNNKTKRATTQQVRGDTSERLKKFLAGLGKTRHLVPHDPLRVSLEDFRAAETKGKWWLVGAAWSRDPLVERMEDSKRESKRQGGDTNALSKLAKKQGMNTDIRRSIFIVLMSSDDYVDACERLAQLSLTEIQQREVVRVLVNCCGNENAYNPYYTFVCQHLCKTSHSYRITLQYCLWDFLRDLGEDSVGGIEVLKNLKGNEDGFEVKDVSSNKMRNVANAYAWWVAKDCVALSIFKPVDFTVLKPRTRDFLSHFFHQLFANSQLSTPMLSSELPRTRNKGPLEEIFIKAMRIQALSMGLVYFLTEMKKASGKEFIEWACSIAIDTLRAGVDVVPTL